MMLYVSPPSAIESPVPSVRSAITLRSSLLIPHDLDTKPTLPEVKSFESTIFSKLPPVFPALKIPADIAPTVAGHTILRFKVLFFSMISRVCLSGIHSAIMIIFLKYQLSIPSRVAF